MGDQDTAGDEGFFEKVKDAVGDLLGGNADEVAETSPEIAGDQMAMDQHQRQDIGMGVPDMAPPPYSGTGNQGQQLTDHVVPGTDTRD